MITQKDRIENGFIAIYASKHAAHRANDFYSNREDELKKTTVFLSLFLYIRQKNYYLKTYRIYVNSLKSSNIWHFVCTVTRYEQWTTAAQFNLTRKNYIYDRKRSMMMIYIERSVLCVNGNCVNCCDDNDDDDDSMQINVCECVWPMCLAVGLKIQQQWTWPNCCLFFGISFTHSTLYATVNGLEWYRISKNDDDFVCDYAFCLAFNCVLYKWNSIFMWKIYNFNGIEIVESRYE